MRGENEGRRNMGRTEGVREEWKEGENKARKKEMEGETGLRKQVLKNVDIRKRTRVYRTQERERMADESGRKYAYITAVVEYIRRSLSRPTS